VANTVEHLAHRFLSEEPNRRLLYRLETRAVEIIQRHCYFVQKIAKEIIQEAEASIEDPVMQEELAAAATHSLISFRKGKYKCQTRQ
jgi:hypothetical protein